MNARLSAKFLAQFSEFLTRKDYANAEEIFVKSTQINMRSSFKNEFSVDYLHSNPKILIDTNGLIHSHNDYGIGRYHLDRDEIIHNPENNFYHRGIKFASLNVIKELKLKRNEPKDEVDIKLINSVL